MLEALCLLVGVLIGAGLAWYFMRETTGVAANIIAGYRQDLGAALDRIQAPDLEAYKNLTRPEPVLEAPPGFLYDPTGLIEAEVEE